MPTRILRRLRFACVAMSIVAPAALSAQVRRVGPMRVQAEPGASVTVAFGVRNAGASPASAGASVPPGWPLVSPDADAPLAPGASAVRLVATVVPRGAAAGAYVVRYRAGAFADSAIVAVAERRAIEVAVEEQPRFVVAGTEYDAAFRVTNRGNGRVAVRLSVESALGFAARVDARALDLATGASAVVRIRVATRTGAGASTHRVTLRAQADGAAPASASTRVPLVQRSARGGVDARTLPVTVGLRASAGTDGRGGIPGVVSASGAVTTNTRVDLFYRGRGAAAPELGEQEQLSFSLRAPLGEVRLGDQFWMLSPLTAPGRAGFGAGGRIAAGPVWAEGFSARNRFVATAPRTTGGAIGIGGETGSLAANWASVSDGSPAVTSLRARLNPLRGVGADAEAATADGARAGYARIFASQPGWGVDVRRLEADEDFPGEQHGRSLLQANGRATLPLGLRANAGYEREARVDTLGRVLAGTPLASSMAYGTLAYRDVATLQRREQTREGVGVAGEFARRSDSWIASATWRAGRASFGGGMEMGTVRDDVAGSSSPFQRTWIRAGTSGRLGSAWAAVERRTGTSVETGIDADRISGSVAVQLQPDAATRVSLLAQAGANELTDRPDGFVDGTVERRLPGGHTLRLRVRAFPWAEPGRRAPLVFLDWSVPLGLPIGRDGSAGAVSGRVLDQETGRPVSGALVRVGDRAVVTDGRGRWAVTGLPPGEYAVEIDPVSIGVGRIAVRPDALKVQVAGGREHEVEVGVARAAKVEGRIAVTDPEDGTGGVAGAVIELRRGDDRRRRVTDADGRFLFSDLPPGDWTVAVVSADLPPNHALERDAVPLTLSPGQSASVELRAVPRHREMVIVSGGDLVPGGAPVRGATPPAVSGTTPAAPRVPDGAAPRATDRTATAADRGAAGMSTIPGSAAAPAISGTEPPAVRAMPALPGLLTPQPRPAAPASSVTQAPAADATAQSSQAAAPAQPPAAAPAERAAMRASARPWRERGASGFSDWPNDTYVVQDGDASLEAIAWLVYRDGSLWPKLWLANRDVLASPDRLRPGLELLIPPFAPLTQEERDAARALRRR